MVQNIKETESGLSTALGLYEAPFVVFITGSARTVAHWQISLLRSLALVMVHIYNSQLRKAINCTQLTCKQSKWGFDFNQFYNHKAIYNHVVLCISL